MKNSLITVTALALLAPAAVSLAQAPGIPRSRPQVAPLSAPASALATADKAPASPSMVVDDKLVTTSHVTKIDGVEIRYVATAGTLVLRHPNGKARGHMFFVAYAREGQEAATRPITFSYNGGPGSPAIWLHMGLMGPKRVKMAAEGFQPGPPYELVTNNDSPLDVTDIVMIDPIQTGFSRAAEGEDSKQFTSVTGDIESVADFIRLYLTKFKRWPSPKFLLGESYGTMRSAGVAQELQSRHGVELNGIVLVSSILDYLSKGYAAGHDLPYANFLPSFTAIAWYHKKLPRDLQEMDQRKAIDEARSFAFGEYLTALAKGNRLTMAERQSLAEKVARYSGLSADFVMRANLRVTDPRFRKELLRDRGVTLGRLDARYTGLDADGAGEFQEYDPSNDALAGPYVALFSNYVRDELKWESDARYYTSGQVQPWNYAPYSNRYLNLLDELRTTMAHNPYLRVMVANGYYDMATPFTATEHTFAHLGYEDTYKNRVSLKYFQGGHMMYTHPDLLRALKHDIAEFVNGAKMNR
ncbi:MAG: peptidase S10 [Vicinamibacteria bacterium]|nr:peptidase S10 [Vicinamibacteria bacterium]